jgi:hypothetical protein
VRREEVFGRDASRDFGNSGLFTAEIAERGALGVLASSIDTESVASSELVPDADVASQATGSPFSSSREIPTSSREGMLRATTSARTAWSLSSSSSGASPAASDTPDALGVTPDGPDSAARARASQ